jgi:hypothetical protein
VLTRLIVGLVVLKVALAVTRVAVTSAYAAGAAGCPLGTNE